MSRYDAVVFDLWGTLVDELTHPEAHRLVYRRKTDETADLLGVDRDEFVRAWSVTAPDRMVGRIASTEATLRLICAQGGRGGGREGRQGGRQDADRRRSGRAALQQPVPDGRQGVRLRQPGPTNRGVVADVPCGCRARGVHGHGA